MTKDPSAPRTLQQQPQRESDPQQQRAGDTDFQSHGKAQSGQAQGGQVEGEGSYSATRDYQKNIKEYLDKGDVQADAEAAKPRSESEARELEQAEREGKSHSKGER
ncbi:hypothetical protein GCM10028796_43760 [Ramlibacter monticola]|uniref:Uncharacterized protein n=1 Tax=Ramlibacter monticola TaxID=1926872 RepID=A0A936Z132_9BURK|nr:hypothetical protein [Ramlibacter monticola]MBL0392975.1 hypothetical protein [Ramlibacter monticola]